MRRPFLLLAAVAMALAPVLADARPGRRILHGEPWQPDL